MASGTVVWLMSEGNGLSVISKQLPGYGRAGCKRSVARTIISRLRSTRLPELTKHYMCDVQIPLLGGSPPIKHGRSCFVRKTELGSGSGYAILNAHPKKIAYHVFIYINTKFV